MPTYHYQCGISNQIFEISHSIHDGALINLPESFKDFERLCPDKVLNFCDLFEINTPENLEEDYDLMILFLKHFYENFIKIEKELPENSGVMTSGTTFYFDENKNICLGKNDKFINFIVNKNMNYSPSSKFELSKLEYGPLKRLMPSTLAFVLKGDGWTVSDKTRGYKGRFPDLIRERGTDVTNPCIKREADQQFNRFVNLGGLNNVPDFDIKKAREKLYSKDNPCRPRDAEATKK